MYFSLFALFLVFPSYGVASSPAMQPRYIGYGSADSVLPAKDHEWFLSGFELGFTSLVNKKPFSSYVLVNQVFNGSQMGPLIAAKELFRRQAVAIVGFPTSHEALMAAEIARESKTIGIFIGASHNKLAQMGPYVFTTGESTRLMAERLVNFIGKKFGNAKGLVISNPAAAFSNDLALSLHARRLSSPVSFDSAKLGLNGMLPQKEIGFLKRGVFHYICITTYANDARSLMDQLEREEIDLPIVVNSTWVTGDIEFVRRFLSKIKSNIYSQTDWIPGSPESEVFEKLLMQKLGKKPILEIAYGYDLGVVVGHVVNSIEGPITKEAFESAFRARRCYGGTSTGEICFDPRGGHANRKLKMVKINKSGFEIIKAF